MREGACACVTVYVCKVILSYGPFFKRTFADLYFYDCNAYQIKFVCAFCVLACEGVTARTFIIPQK